MSRSADAAEPHERHERLKALRNRKMADSAHAFVRANAKLFYDVLGRRGAWPFPAGPPVWISADCHGENLGAIADREGRATMEMNDLDEAVVSEPAYDLLRLALSLAMACRASGLTGRETAVMARRLEDGYTAGLVRPHGEAGADDGAPPRFAKLLRKAARQTRTSLLDHRVPASAGAPGGRRFALGPRYWPLTESEHERVRALVEKKSSVRALVTSLTAADDDDEPVTVLDAAFRVAGTASLGAWRGAALVRVGAKRKGGGADEALRLLDIKEALPSDAPRARGATCPTDDAERVVAAARVLAPSIGDRMIAATLAKRRVIVRELMPQDLKVDFTALASDEVAEVSRYAGAIVGRAHGRQMTIATARGWKRALREAGGRGKGPSTWLWDSLAELVGVHEPAYLRHCASI